MNDPNGLREIGDQTPRTRAESLARRGARRRRTPGGLPTTAAGLLAIGGVLAASASVVQLALSEDSAVAEPGQSVTSSSPAESSTQPTQPTQSAEPSAQPTQPTQFEPKGDQYNKPGGGDDDKDAEKLEPLLRWQGAPGDPSATYVYVIHRGDTLSTISGETGVPVGLLVEVNKIQDPNFIYAGASLLIPPVS